MPLTSFRFSIRALMIATAVLGLLLGAGAWQYRRWSAPVVKPVYIHPLEMDETAQDALDEAGVEVYGFEYSIPKGHFATITFVARDAQGLIPELSWVYTETDDSAPVRVRLLRLNPDDMREQKTDRLQWIFKVGGTSTSHWIDNPAKGVNGVSTRRSHPPRIENPTPGKTYRIMDYDVSGARAGQENMKFSIGVRFKFEPLKANGPPLHDTVSGYQEDPKNPDPEPADDGEPE